MFLASFKIMFIGTKENEKNFIKKLKKSCVIFFSYKKNFKLFELIDLTYKILKKGLKIERYNP